jgi:hypothetical protein
MKDKIKEIITGNADDYDQLSDNQAHSYKFYQGTLDSCIDDISDLIKSELSEVVEDVKQAKLYLEDGQLFGSNMKLQSILSKLKNLTDG